jgi:hypothetical protein
MNYILISSLIIILVLIILFTSSSIEPFETSLNQTPAERGLVFGYVDGVDTLDKVQTPKPASRNITSKDTISIFSKDQYLGFSNKNALFPNFLERLGTFTPYTYENVKILSKNDEPIIYNKTPVSFSITYLHEEYYLQYVPNTNTFYLTNTPSYFLLISAMNNDKSSIALYDDTILIKCLDNSEYLLVYDNFIVTQPKNSSTFVIKRSSDPEKCINLMPRSLDPIQIKLLEDTYKRDIDNHILKLTNEKAGIINSIKNEIKSLQVKLKNSKSIENIQIQRHKLELENTLKVQQTLLNDEITKFKLEKESEFNKNKSTMINTKKTKWDKELATIKEQMNKHCRIGTVDKQPLLAPKNLKVSPKKPLLSPKHRYISSKKPLLSPKHRYVSPKKPLLSPKHRYVSRKHLAVARKYRYVSPKHKSVSPKHRYVSPKRRGFLHRNY